MDLSADQIAVFASSGKLVYVLLAAMIKYLHSIASELHKISTNLAVMSARYDEKFEDHDRRLTTLETKTGGP